jgi:hypothetical protein
MTKSVSRFASVIEISTRNVFAFIVLCFALYASGLIPSAMSLESIAANWHLPLQEYRLVSGTETGAWSWLPASLAPDLLAVFAIALLGLLIPIAYVIAVFSFKSENKNAYMVMAAAEVLLLTAAVIGLV